MSTGPGSSTPPTADPPAKKPRERRKHQIDPALQQLTVGKAKTKSDYLILKAVTQTDGKQVTESDWRIVAICKAGNDDQAIKHAADVIGPGTYAAVVLGSWNTGSWDKVTVEQLVAV
jgi:hypothetical protein